MKGLRRICLALSVTAALTVAGPAPAQDDDVFVNPDSPSGVEYDLPLERARRDADPARRAGDAVLRQSRSAAPFGAGVGEPEGSSGAGGAGGAGGKSKARTQRDGKARARRDSALPPEVVAAAARPVSPVDSGGSTLVYAGIGALIVAAGGLAGLLLRRRRDAG